VKAGGWHGPLAAFVWKTVADPYVGQDFLLSRGFWDVARRFPRVEHARRPRGAHQPVVHPARQGAVARHRRCRAGDIGIVAKLSTTGTNDTLCDKATQLIVPQPTYPDPLYSVAVTPEDQGGLGQDGPRAHARDRRRPDPRMAHGAGTSETILWAWARCTWTWLSAGWSSKFGVGLTLQCRRCRTRSPSPGARPITTATRSRPAARVSSAKSTWKSSRSSAARASSSTRARVRRLSHPEFLPVDRKGHPLASTGPLAGYPVVDVRCEVYDGKMHPVDSKDIAFQIAGREVFKKTFLQAGPVLLEPIMDVPSRCPKSTWATS
jgi:elongation factor G